MSGSTPSRRRFLKLSSATALSAMANGCGTVLYPERMGQRRGGFDDVDWTVAGLNGIGLVFFLVPGTIAFAIDFYNGTLFYPSPTHYGDATTPSELKQVSLPEENPSLETVEHAVAEETGRPVKLKSGTFLSRRLKSIKEFWTADRELSHAAS